MLIKRTIENSLPGVQKNISLKNYTTFKIGGNARYFFNSKTKNDLPFFILGGGSNLLVSDNGFEGLVVKMQTTNCKLQTNSKKHIMSIYAEAGVTLGQLVNFTLKNNLTGLEWAVGIPGTLGGAVFGNAGAFGGAIADSVREVEFFDSKSLKFFKRKNKKCKFSYRKSIFKGQKNWIIVSAELGLRFAMKREIKKKIKGYLDEKRKKQPMNLPSAGSVFVNPDKFSAGELIEKCGLKGKRKGRVEISEMHANFMVNLGGGKANDVINLINLAKKSVKNKFGINLKEEIQYLGFFPLIHT